MGLYKGKQLKETYEVGDTPWFQPLSYSLRSFVTGKPARAELWTIRPDTLKPLRMTVEKLGVETLQTAQGDIEAQRLRIGLTGMMKYLWKAYYWFDTRQVRFVRYEGVNGPRGTPKTIIELSSIPPLADLGRP